MYYCFFIAFFFFFNDTATTEIYTYGHTLSLHDALPISVGVVVGDRDLGLVRGSRTGRRGRAGRDLRHAVEGIARVDERAAAVADLRIILGVGVANLGTRPAARRRRQLDARHLAVRRIIGVIGAVAAFVDRVIGLVALFGIGAGRVVGRGRSEEHTSE